MALSIATHDGPFHADDVMAVALLKTFVDPEATVDRSRDPARWDAADVVVDVGGVFDAEARRFDHHQAAYTGSRSSAGMVLDWLEPRLEPSLARSLREGVVDYLDDVDNGRLAPDPRVPCFPRIVSALAETGETREELDRAFARAVDVGRAFLEGLVAGDRRVREAEAIVVTAMDEARDAGRNVLFLDDYVSWKAPYFAHGGEGHPTSFVLFPGLDGSWRIVAIPPVEGSFAQKQPLPEAWAGLTDADLEAVTGIPGAVFCHRNRFIAVFKTREGALKALDDNGLLRR
ncbi:MAG: MYG1 family protein [Myxococcales bacterium]|nr:MYG1 family protein [Myxococcales bacterium]